MERNNPKQLKLTSDVGELAEQVHRDYQSYSKTNMSFRTFGNMVMHEGLEMVALQMKVQNKHRKRRRING